MKRADVKRSSELWMFVCAPQAVSVRYMGSNDVFSHGAGGHPRFHHPGDGRWQRMTGRQTWLMACPRAKLSPLPQTILVANEPALQEARRRCGFRSESLMDTLGETQLFPNHSRSVVECQRRGPSAGNVAVAHPQRERCSHNLARGANISCLSFWVCAGLPTRAREQWAVVGSMAKVSGQRSTISGQWSVNDECPMVKCPPGILAFGVMSTIPKTRSLFLKLFVKLSHQFLCGFATPTIRQRKTPAWRRQRRYKHEGEPTYGEHGTVPATWECQQHIKQV